MPMKKIVLYFSEFHRSYFSFRLYAFFLFFVALLIGFNYTFDFEDSFIDQQPKPMRVVGYFLYHFVAYFGVLVIIWRFSKEKLRLNGYFWAKSLVGFLILGIDNSYYSNYALLQNFLPSGTVTFYNKLLVNSIGLLTMFAPLLIVKFVFDRKQHFGIYGLTFSKVDWKPYWIMLVAMAPLIYAASYLPDFISYYPVYKRAGGAAFADYYSLHENWSIAVFETFYIADFIFTELFFRGFLVVGLGVLLGKNAVLPMAASYAVLHFGKPAGEAISSVFGGYILGIIALYSRNIWGGVFVHSGIAGLMELFAFWRMP
jgi:hypothetical protein